MNSKEFSLKIESIVKEKKISHMDAVVLYCEKENIEIETASKLLNSALKSKIEVEAQSLNFLPKTSKLPI